MTRRRILIILGVMFALDAIYLLAWPVPIDPVAWDAPTDPGYTGDFAVNTRLAAAELIPLPAGQTGPEAVAADASGQIFTGTHEGLILRLAADGKTFEQVADTQGRPLGLMFDAAGRLLVADAYRGLLAVDVASGAVTLLTDSADGVPIRYADDLDVADDGTVYFSDASTKFGAKEIGGTYEASLLDINEHAGNGRLLAFDPKSGETRVVRTGLQFANGVAVAHDQRSVLVVETGSYRVTRVWLDGPKAGQSEPVISNLPGFPDNVKRGADGRYWVGLTSPRNALVDRFSGSPFVRRIFERLPTWIKPGAVAYPHVLAIDEQGRVVVDLQNPDGAHAFTTGAIETADHIYISSLRAPTLARLARAEALP